MNWRLCMRTKTLAVSLYALVIIMILLWWWSHQGG
jgi:hypothetical protein